MTCEPLFTVTDCRRIALASTTKKLRAKVEATVEHWQFLYGATVPSVASARRRSALRYLAVLRKARTLGIDWRALRARTI